MMDLEKNTTWMWADPNSGTQGLIIDVEQQRLLWYDSIGCACGDSSFSQSYSMFLQRSTPLSVPEDILAEIRETVVALDSQQRA